MLMTLLEIISIIIFYLYASLVELINRELQKICNSSILVGSLLTKTSLECCSNNA